MLAPKIYGRATAEAITGYIARPTMIRAGHTKLGVWVEDIAVIADA
jgi:hypothetical protein